MHRALLIGVADYDHRPPLDGPMADVPALTERWRRLGYVVEQQAGFVPAEALQSRVIDFFGRLDGSDVGLLHFSGHAEVYDGGLYLLGSDAQASTGGLPLSLVFERALRSGASVALVLDCCHAGASVDASAFEPAKGSPRTLLVLGAAGPRTASREVDGFGPLSAALMAALDGVRDPATARLGAIFDDAKARCRQEGPDGDARQAQSAFVFALSNESVPLTPDAGAKEAPGGRVTTSASRRSRRRARLTLWVAGLMAAAVGAWALWPSTPPGPPTVQILIDGRTRTVDRDEVTAEMANAFRPGIAREGLPFDTNAPPSAVHIAAEAAEAYCRARAMTLPSVNDSRALAGMKPAPALDDPPPVAAKGGEAAKAWLKIVDEADVRGHERIRGLGTRAAEWVRDDDGSWLAAGQSTLAAAWHQPAEAARTAGKLRGYVLTPPLGQADRDGDATVGFRCISPR